MLDKSHWTFGTMNEIHVTVKILKIKEPWRDVPNGNSRCHEEQAQFIATFLCALLMSTHWKCIHARWCDCSGTCAKYARNVPHAKLYILKTYETLKIHVPSLKQDRKKELESLERSSEIMADLRNGLSFSMMTLIWVQRAWFHSLCCGEQFLQDKPKGCEAKSLVTEYLCFCYGAETAETAESANLDFWRWYKASGQTSPKTCISESWSCLYFETKVHETRTFPRPLQEVKWMKWNALNFLDFSSIVSLFRGVQTWSRCDVYHNFGPQNGINFSRGIGTLMPSTNSYNSSSCQTGTPKNPSYCETIDSWIPKRTSRMVLVVRKLLGTSLFLGMQRIVYTAFSTRVRLAKARVSPKSSSSQA